MLLNKHYNFNLSKHSVVRSRRTRVASIPNTPIRTLPIINYSKMHNFYVQFVLNVRARQINMARRSRKFSFCFSYCISLLLRNYSCVLLCVVSRSPIEKSLAHMHKIQIVLLIKHISVSNRNKRENGESERAE